jgi:DNA primase
MDFDRKTLTFLHETAQRYHKGMTEEAYDYLEGRGITRDVAERFLLGVCDDLYPGRLSIPYLRPAGTVAFAYRAITDDSKAKYLTNHKRHLYNTADLDTADQTGEIAICEGELDTITASALYGIPAVGIPGASNWKGFPHWRECFVGYQRIYVLADPDEAGSGLASALMESLPTARLVKLPGDVNECWQAEIDIREFMR